MRRGHWVWTVCGSTLCVGVASALMHAEDAPPAASQPRELGEIQWLRDFDAASAASRKTGKPMLVLFQEVPGCGTCKSYGDRVLSHPLIRDAAESLFVPVAIHNNKPGDDERVLKSFQEPAWNNPVVRIMRHDRSSLAARVAGDYTPAGLVSAMVTALEQEKREIPMYLRLLHEELSARQRGLDRATFAMHCFWEGEGQLGALDGVIATMPGFVKGREVVDVWYDAKRIDYSALVREARRMQCAGTIFARSAAQESKGASIDGASVVRTDDATRPDKEPKYYLSKTPFRFVPMTETQASRVNGAIRSKRDPQAFLSPSQRRILAIAKAHPKGDWRDAIGADDIVQAFAAADRVALKFTRK